MLPAAYSQELVQEEAAPMEAEVPEAQSAAGEAAPSEEGEAAAAPSEAAPAAEEVASPKKSPAGEEEAETAATEAETKSTTKKPRAKKEKPAADEAEAADVGQYWEVQEGKKRERKSLEAFKVEVAKPKEVETQKGTGTVLRDIPRIVELFGMHSIKKADPDDPLKNLSRLLYNKHGGPRECKNNILDFNGFSFADAKAEENMKNRIKKKQLKELKAIMGLLGLDRSGTHQDHVDRLFAFLKKPNPEACTASKPPGLGKKSSGTKRKAKGSKKKGSAKKAKASKGDEDEGEDEDEDEDSEEEEEEKKAPPKKKAKAAPKKETAADSDEDLDKPLFKPKVDPFLEKLKGHVKTVIGEQDMDSLTLRMVREMLAEKFQVDIEKYKANIREYVDEIVSAM